MTAMEDKRRAETAAALYLEMRGYKVVERGWRLPRAKVDIIAKKGQTAYFVEVSYRQTETPIAAEGLNASTLKLRQRAVYLWLEETKWPGNYALARIEVYGPDYIVMSFADNL